MAYKIAILDDVCPKGYDEYSLENDVIGGTEATIIRIATGLAKRGHEVHVKILASKQQKGLFCNTLPAFEPDIAIVLRNADKLLEYKKIYPRAKLFLWLHDLVHFRLHDDGAKIINTDTTTITVSNYHRLQAKTVLRSQAGVDLPVKVIYNPVDDDLTSDGTSFDPKKLIFFSQPAKGLNYTMSVFKKLIQQDNHFKLYVARPGFCNDFKEFGPNVVNLSALKFNDVISHVRSSLCVFYLNHIHPETFGLVMAESNAVGTPVITHPLGAAAEVVSSKDQLINTYDFEKVIARTLEWSKGSRPQAYLKECFRLKNVLNKWEELFLEECPKIH